MHSKDRPCFTTLRKEFFASDSTCNNVAHEWVSFWQVCCEIHFLPLVALLNSQSWKSKVRANCVCTHKVHLAIYKKNLEGQPGSYFQVKYKCSLGVAFHSVSAYRTHVSNYQGYRACERIGHL